jgi:hypothetical protein
MIPKKANVEEEMITFVKSNQFENFQKIMEQYSQAQFKVMMESSDISSEDLKVSRSVLEFYMKFPAYLENKVKKIEERKAFEMREKISKAQEYQD